MKKLVVLILPFILMIGCDSNTSTESAHAQVPEKSDQAEVTDETRDTGK